VDIVDEPLVTVNERNLQILLATALTPLAPRLINQAAAIPLPPMLTNFSVFDARAYAGGAAHDRLTIEADLRR
jgi:hypothetical protein